VIVAATISRFGAYLDGFVHGFHTDPDFAPLVDETLETGVLQTPEGGRWLFTGAYFHRPEELPAEVADAGLTMERIVAVEGPLWMTRWAQVDEATVLYRLRQVEQEPSLLGASSHLLTIVRV
jgi:hypothetical protein